MGGSRDSTRAVAGGRAIPEPGAKGWGGQRVQSRAEQSRAGLGSRPIRGIAIAWSGLA